MFSPLRLTVFLFVTGLGAGIPNATFAEIRVFCSGGFHGAYSAVLPGFEKKTGIKVTTTRAPSQGNYSTTVGRRLARGEPADIVIVAKEALDDLISEGRILPGSEKDLAQSPLGVAVKAGSPHPEISTVEAFKKGLLAAKKIAVGGSYVENRLFPALGLSEQLVPKLVRTGASAVVTGYADIAIQPLSELLPIEGLAVVGLIPGEAQQLVFSVAIVKGSTEHAASTALIDYLSSPEVEDAVRKAGMTPIGSRK